MLITMTHPRPGGDSPTGRSARLPTGTVTLLAVGAADPTRPEQRRQPAAATARLAPAVRQRICARGGVCPTEHDDGGRLVAGFTRASEALAWARDLQRAPPDTTPVRIGIHTGEVHVHDGSLDPTVQHAGRLRELAHPGQTLLSGLTAKLAADVLPAGAWLAELGSYPLRGIPRPQRVVQLCHPTLGNAFPPLRFGQSVAGGQRPAPLTSFVGRETELRAVRELLEEHRLVTLTGAGGVGKSRLAAELVDELAAEFADGVWWTNLASVTHPDRVATSVARTLGMPDQPGRSTLATLVRFIADGQMLLVLDDCEHVLDACAAVATGLATKCPRLRIVATSREPIGITGEVSWRIPSLSLADEAIELFVDRARLARRDFAVTADNVEMIGEICRRLDGLPLAIELAAARVRALSLAEVADGLHDRFRLLTGGARTAVARQQTLQASMDWSHALLAPSERVLLRRLGVFLDGFDLDAAHAVAADFGQTRYQIRDGLSLLVDKSLVVAEQGSSPTRYRLLETMRRYALDKLAESGEGDAVRVRHRNHYTELFDVPVLVEVQPLVERAQTEMDNLRAAFGWSRERGDIDMAARLASSLQPLWLARGHILEGLDWFGAVLADKAAMTPAVRARALADKLILDHLAGNFDSLAQADEALAIARGLDDPNLLARVLTACGVGCIFHSEVALDYLAEATDLVRALGDDWQLSWISGWRANAAYLAGDPAATRAAAEQGRDLADAIGEGVLSRMCRWLIGQAQWLSADLVSAAAQFRDVIATARAAHDPMWTVYSLFMLARTLAYQGDTGGAQHAAEQAVEAAADITGIQRALTFGAMTYAALAAGEPSAAAEAGETAWQACPHVALLAANSVPIGQAALANGDLPAARRWADDAVAAAKGAHRMPLLSARARTAIAQGDFSQADRDARAALAIAAETNTALTVPDAIECLAVLSAEWGDHRTAARLFGAAAAIRERTGQVRFKVYDAGYAVAVDTVRAGLRDDDFGTAWAAGAALCTEEAIEDALRSSAVREHPTNGWASLTRTELDVVRLVGQGLANKDIAARLLVSPRTMQTHLTHVYAKLGLSSRVQLAQEASRHR